MIKTMNTMSLLGISAIQVGTPLRIFVIRPAIKIIIFVAEPIVFVNPTIITQSCETESHDECCSSNPKTVIKKIRPSSLMIEAFDMQGKKFQWENVSDLIASEIFHQMEHLDGKNIEKKRSVF
jgi:peptide deformylase